MINKTPNWSFRTIDKKMQTFFHMCEREREKQVVLGATSGTACGDRKSLKLGDRLTSILAKPQGGAEPPSSVSWAHGRSRHALAHASALLQPRLPWPFLWVPAFVMGAFAALRRPWAGEVPSAEQGCRVPCASYKACVPWSNVRNCPPV